MSAISAEFPCLFFANALGDHILSYPAISAMAEAYPGRITLLALCGRGDLFFSELDLRAVHEVRPLRDAGDTLGGAALPVEALAAAARPCDLFVCLNPWDSHATRQLAVQLEPDSTVGMFDWYDIHVPLDCDKHSADLAFDVARRVAPAAEFDRHARPPAFSPAGRTLAREVRAMIPPGTRLLAVHTDTAGAKQWTGARFVAALEQFVGLAPEYMLLVVGKSHDLPLTGSELERRTIDACGLPLDRTFPLVGACDLFLGVDSCMLHAADFHGVPGVGLFGPTAAREFGFRVAPHRHVCGDRMEEIDPAEVASALHAVHREVVVA